MNKLAYAHDVMAAILAFQNNETAAILVYQTNTVAAQLSSYVNNGGRFRKKLWCWVSGEYYMEDNVVLSAGLIM